MKPLSARDFDHQIADATPKKVVLRIRRNRGQGSLRFVTNPATGALEIPADLRAEIAYSLMAEMRRFQLRLYQRLALLYLLKFRLQAQCAFQNVAGYLKRGLL
jgi:hypothetical protein